MLQQVPKPVPEDARPMRARSAGAMESDDLVLLLQDIEHQPEWRTRADKAAAYYDGRQLTGARARQAEETGEPKTVVNLIGRTINGALGYEAKSRLDWRATSDIGAYSEVADVISHRLHQASREAKSSIAISEAYKSEVVAGIGWVEVSRSPSPLAYPYRVEPVHRNEVWWDFRARFGDLRDAKWVCRQRWVDIDEAEALMPEHRNIFRVGCHTGPLTDALAQYSMATEMFDDLYERRRSFNRFQEEWLDAASRRRVRFYDIHYKVWKQVVALVAGDLRVRFDPQNVMHVAMVQRGIGQLVKGPDFTIRRAMFAGPFRLFDIETPMRRFPLIPFWGYRDDEDSTPYGLVAGMIDPQDEYNERRSRLRWLLKAKQVFVDNDALDNKYNTFRDLALEVMRPDGMFVLNANRRNAQGIKVEQNLQLSREQVEVMQDAKQLIQDVPGIYNALLGNAGDGVTSGVALNSLVEQSITSLGELNDNYREARQMVGEALLDLIVEDLKQPEMQVPIGEGKRSRVVVLNTFDETGAPVNHVSDAPIKIGLADVPNTPAYRMQQQQQITQILQGAGQDPAARAVLLPAFIETTDIPFREEYARWLRQQYGVPQPGESEQGQEDAQAEMAAKEQAAQMAQVGQELQMRAAVADVAKKEAEAQRAQADVGRAQVDVARGARELEQPPDENEVIRQVIAEAMQQPLAA